MPESFDEAFPGGFEECVSTLGSREGIDDPEALCGWLQEHGFQAISDANPETILADLSVEFVSVVDEPAQRSEWLLAKDEDGPDAEDLDRYETWTAPYLVRKLSDDEETPDDAEAEQKVWAAVLVPGESDKQDDLVPEHEIESAAHDYLRDYRKVDEDHTLRDGAGVPIESYIVRGGAEEFETPDGDTVEYPPGTWIMGVQVGQDEWKKVLDGDLNGFSIYGGASPLQATDLLTEKQRKAISAMTDGEATAKQVDAADAATVLTVLDEYLGAGADPDTEIQALAEWVAEDAPDDVTEEATILDEDEDADADEEAEADADADKSENSDMADESPDTGDEGQDETNDLLKEVHETVQETQKSIDAHGDRLDTLDDRVASLEKDEEGDGENGEEGGDGEGDGEGDAPTTEEVEETAEKAATKAVEKSLRDLFDLDEDDEVDEVVRKYQFEPEATEEEEGLDISLDGITGGEA